MNTTESRGDETTFICSAVGNGTLSIIWRLPNGETVDTGQDMMDEWNVDSSLSIVDITVEDGGSYLCIVLNEAGETEATAMLFVNLYTSGELVGLNTISGSVENITCMIEGYPITYQWEKMDLATGDENMTNNYSLVSVEQVLQFNPVEFGDEGVYRCVGHSDVGDSLTSNEISVTSELF